MEKESILHGQGRLCRYSRQLKLNWILLNEGVRREPIGEAPNKKNSIGVSRVNASIPFQIKPWEYEEMKTSDEKVNIGAFREVKKQYLARGEGLLTYTWIISEMNHPTQRYILRDDYDDMIYTLLLKPGREYS